MASRWVGLPQVEAVAVSGCVALRLPLPGDVVTWFVTGVEARQSVKALVDAYRFRRHLYYATCAIPVSTPSSNSEGDR